MSTYDIRPEINVYLRAGQTFDLSKEGRRDRRRVRHVRWTPGEPTVTVWAARIRQNGTVNSGSLPEDRNFATLPLGVQQALTDCLASLTTKRLWSEK